MCVWSPPRSSCGLGESVQAPTTQTPEAPTCAAQKPEELQLKENKVRIVERERSRKPLFKYLGKWRGKKKLLFQLLWKCILLEDGDSSLTLKSPKSNIPHYNTPVSLQGEWVIKLEDECFAVQLTASVKKEIVINLLWAPKPSPLKLSFASPQPLCIFKDFDMTPLSHFYGVWKFRSKKEKKSAN